jgi:alkylated DNA repair dioxygenase AlkB
MDLFNSSFNLLPFDGDVEYQGAILDPVKAQLYFEQLLENIVWENDKVILFGKVIITKRKVAWYGDEPFEYTYSKNKKSALLWTDPLVQLKQIVEQVSGETYNSCLLNLYHSGEEGMAYHSDNEKDLKEKGTIASLSLGATRRFLFKHKQSKQTIPVLLDSGSLLLMKGETQQHWLHRLPTTTKVKSARINLTFRTIAV